MPSSPRSPWGVVSSPSFKSLLSYAENPPQELASERALGDITSTWIGSAIRKDQHRRYFSAVSRSDGFRSLQFRLGDDVMVLAPQGGLPYIARIEALFELLDTSDEDGAAVGGEADRQDRRQAQLRWYYRPCDCEGSEARARLQAHSKSRAREVFASTWTDENPIDSFLKSCYVLPRDVYASVAGEVYDDVFFCKEKYCPVKRRFSDCEAEIRRRDHRDAVRVLASRKLASYQKPKVGPEHQCVVPPACRSSSPCCDRGDKLVFEASIAFQGRAGRSEAADKLLKSFRINDSSSAGVSEEVALMALFRTGGDVHKTGVQLERLKDQHVSGSDAEVASAVRRQAQAMEREKREHERDLLEERSQELAGKFDLGDTHTKGMLAPRRGRAGSGGVGLGVGGVPGAASRGGRRDMIKKRVALVELSCGRGHPDGDNSNRGVFFDIENKSSSRVLVTAFAAGTFSSVAEVCVWACKSGTCQGQERKSVNWREIWRGKVASRQKTQMNLAEPLVLQVGQAQGILMHCAADRVCYSRKLEVAEDKTVRLTPWLATGSKVPFGEHQQDDYKYTHAGSITYTTQKDPIEDLGAEGDAAPGHKGRRKPCALVTLPRDNRAKDKWECEVCNLFFASPQALGSHKSTSGEHQDKLARMQDMMGVGEEGSRDAERAHTGSSAPAAGCVRELLYAKNPHHAALAATRLPKGLPESFANPAQPLWGKLVLESKLGISGHNGISDGVHDGALPRRMSGDPDPVMPTPAPAARRGLLHPHWYLRRPKPSSWHATAAAAAAGGGEGLTVTASSVAWRSRAAIRIDQDLPARELEHGGEAVGEASTHEPAPRLASAAVPAAAGSALSDVSESSTSNPAADAAVDAAALIGGSSLTRCECAVGAGRRLKRAGSPQTQSLQGVSCKRHGAFTSTSAFSDKRGSRAGPARSAPTE